ncbi:MAG: GlsB/YeaQ/YmgE family stress response membrane protein [Mangrovibacterium sp.]
MGWIWFILIGILAGFIAGKIMKGSGFGLIVNFIVGVLGALIGGWIFGALNIDAGGKIGSLITAVVGAIVLLWLVSLFKKKT